MDLADLADQRVKSKDSNKWVNNIDLARDLKNLLNMKITMVPVVIGALGTTPLEHVKGLENLEIREQVETIQTTGSLGSVRIVVERF